MSHPIFPTEGLRSFFERFQSLSAASDVDGLAAMYAGSVMIAGAGGTLVVNAADLQRAIPRRKQVLESAGCRDTALVDFEETALGSRYSLVRTQFRWRFAPANGQQHTVTVPSVFIVDRGGESPRIVFYLNEHDVMSVLRERGALPPAT